MSSVKSVTGLLLFAKNEASYGAGANFAATDAIQVAQELPVFNMQYNFDGNRQGAQWSGGNIRRTGPGGRTVEGTVVIEGKGLGSAYGVNATPPNIHPFLLASGLSGSVSASGWLYRPVPLGTQPKSLALNVYDRGELLPVSGAYANMSFAAEGAGLTMFTFAVQGLCADITDVSNPPTRTYTAVNVLPPKNEAVQFVIGSYSSAKIRNYSYTHNLTITPRINLNEATGHAGFAIGRRSPELTITIEADALATFDAYQAWRDGDTFNVELTVGTTANNRFLIRFPQAQISNVERANDEPVALWNLTLTPAVSGPDSSDDVELYWS
jgi:hypothetical protein